MAQSSEIPMAWLIEGQYSSASNGGWTEHQAIAQTNTSSPPSQSTCSRGHCTADTLFDFVSAVCRYSMSLYAQRLRFFQQAVLKRRTGE